jgi:hypothetical protein
MLLTPTLALLAVTSAATLTAALPQQDGQLQEPLRQPSAEDVVLHSAGSAFQHAAKQVEMMQQEIIDLNSPYKDTEPNDDPRWNMLNRLCSTLKGLYPLSHDRMTRTKIEKSGFVYELAAENSTLTPMILTSYFPGAIDVQGTSDQSHGSSSGSDNERTVSVGDFWDQNRDIARLFSSLESLLRRPDWQPRRTLIIALRFDEDAMPERGAGTITQFLGDTYGPDSRFLIMSEGDPVLELLAGSMCEGSTCSALTGADALSGVTDD